MNVNLAPVLDVFHAPGDLMDSYERSFSSNASVAATVKHFPGLGKANAGDNTDSDPVTLSVPLTTLRSVVRNCGPATVSRASRSPTRSRRVPCRATARPATAPCSPRRRATT